MLFPGNINSFFPERNACIWPLGEKLTWIAYWSCESALSYGVFLPPLCSFLEKGRGGVEMPRRKKSRLDPVARGRHTTNKMENKSALWTKAMKVFYICDMSWQSMSTSFWSFFVCRLSKENIGDFCVPYWCPCSKQNHRSFRFLSKNICCKRDVVQHAVFLI